MRLAIGDTKTGTCGIAGQWNARPIGGKK